MVHQERVMNRENALSMKVDKAVYLNGTFTPIKAKGCVHQRRVNCHGKEKCKPTGNLQWQENGAVISDPLKVLG